MISLKEIVGALIDYEFEYNIQDPDCYKEIYCLTESPMRIDNINMDILNTLSENYKYVLKLKEYGKIIDKYKEYDIYQFNPTNDKSNIIDIFVYGDIAYIYFDYKLTTDNFIEEQKIWQDHLNLSLFRKIMFNYYLKKYKGVISDVTLSKNGENYWKKILKTAKDSGYNIYVLKNNTQKIPINDVNNIDIFFKSINYKFVIEK